ncbi:MAG: 50S ribosomal protein L17 [bacterium]
MRHAKKEAKLNRDPTHRKATVKNLIRALVKEERIKTTLAKAKAIRPKVEKLITRAAEDTVHNRREVKKKIRDDELVKKMFEDIGPRFADRPGGYTRILKLDRRKNDNAQRALIEFVE